MYIPSSFAVTDTTILQDFLERHSFALLVTQLDGIAFASHLPLLLDRTAGPYGTILGHMARANPQWTTAAGQTALAIFSGPHAYISPTWYEGGPAVPTWNYTAVHATGRLELVEDSATLLHIVRQSVQVYEQSMPQRWQLDESGPYVERLLLQIVGFRIPIDTLEGKWKLSQNHSLDRQQKVATALAAQSDENSRDVAEMMRAGFPSLEIENETLEK